MVNINQKEKEMREKNKRIIKGIGVGALACVGMIGLTGCANVSKTDYSRIMDSVAITENAVSLEEGTKVYLKAMNNIINTSSKFWTNMKVEQTSKVEFNGEELFTEYVEIYMLQDTERQLFLHKTIGETDSYEDNTYRGVYAEGENVTVVQKDVDSQNKRTSNQSEFIKECFGLSCLEDFYVLNTDNNGDAIIDDHSRIIGARKNDKGNYVITTVERRIYEDEGIVVEMYFIENEIDANFNFVSQNIEVEGVHCGDVMKGNMVNNFSYETVEYLDVQSEMEELLEYEHVVPQG